jgi:hypothetical protein
VLRDQLPSARLKRLFLAWHLEVKRNKLRVKAGKPSIHRAFDAYEAECKRQMVETAK